MDAIFQPIFQMHFLNENLCISMKISLKFVLKGPINNIRALVQIIAVRRLGEKPLMVSLLTHICVIRTQWVYVVGDVGLCESKFPTHALFHPAWIPYCSPSNWGVHYIDVLMTTMASQINSPTICLFNRLFRRRSKKTSKLRVNGLCVRNSPDRWIPRTKGQLRGKCFHLMTSSCIDKCHIICFGRGREALTGYLYLRCEALLNAWYLHVR